MKNISIYFVVFVLFGLSCSNHSKIDSQEVRNKIDSIDILNQENKFNESLSILKSLDSLYPTDTKIKEQYVKLLKETSLKRAKYNIKTLTDSISYIDSCIKNSSNLYSNIEILDKLDTDRGDHYLQANSINYDNSSGLSIRVNINNAIVDIISKLVSSSKQDYQQIKIIDKKDNNSWLSQSIPYDQATNYRYSILGKWVQTVDFELSHLNEFRHFINADLSGSIYLLFLNNGKATASIKLTKQDIEKLRAIIYIQNLVARSCEYKKELLLSKETITRLSNKRD